MNVWSTGPDIWEQSFHNENPAHPRGVLCAYDSIA